MAEDRLKEITVDLVSEIAWNNVEASYAEDIDESALLNLKKVYVVENFREKKGKFWVIVPFDDKLIAKNERTVRLWQAKAPNAEVVLLFQRTKGTERTDKEQVLTQKAQGLCTIVYLHERSALQTAEKFGQEIEAHDFSGKKKGVLLQIESKELEQKVSLALSKGVKEFVLIAGKYASLDLWKSILNRIHYNRGHVCVQLSRRFDKQKKAHTKLFITLGVDEILNGKYPPPAKEQKKVILCLDEDLTFREENDLLNDALKKKMGKQLDSKKYSAARVFALDMAQRYAKAHPVKMVVKA